MCLLASFAENKRTSSKINNSVKTQRIFSFSFFNKAEYGIGILLFVMVAGGLALAEEKWRVYELSFYLPSNKVPTNAIIKIEFQFASEIRKLPNRLYGGIICDDHGRVVPVTFQESGHDFMRRHYLAWVDWENNQRRMDSGKRGYSFGIYHVYGIVTTQIVDTVRGKLPAIYLLGSTTIQKAGSASVYYQW